MKTKKLVIAIIMVLFSCSAVVARSANQPWLEITSDKVNGVYLSNDNKKPVATFTLKALGETKKDATLTYKIQWNKYKDLAKGTIVFKDGIATISQEFPGPGCINLLVFQGKQKELIGVVCDPFKITYTTPEPDGFDTFWKKQLEALAKVPMNARLNPIDTTKPPFAGKRYNSDKVEYFEVLLDTVDKGTVYSYYACPKGAKAKSCPAYLSIPGAGMRDSSLWGPHSAALYKKGISINLNAHGFPHAQPKEFYKKKAKELHGYRYWGDKKPDTLYLKNMIMRYLRGIDFLAAQPEWNGQLILSGASQGGMAVILAGLDPRVTEVKVWEPSYFDRDQRDKIYAYKRNGKTRPAHSIKTFQYFDACHFAKRFKGKSHFEIGLIDYAVPAKGVFAGFNVLPGEKDITILPQRNHGGGKYMRERRKDPAFTHKP